MGGLVGSVPHLCGWWRGDSSGHIRDTSPGVEHQGKEMHWWVPHLGSLTGGGKAVGAEVWDQMLALGQVLLEKDMHAEQDSLLV